jgi:hypothetical protein
MLSKPSRFFRDIEKRETLLCCVVAGSIQARAMLQAVSHWLPNVETLLKSRVTSNVTFTMDEAALEYVILLVHLIFLVSLTIQPLFHTSLSPLL